MVDAGLAFSEVHGQILDAVFDLVELKSKHNFSGNCFNSILQWGKNLFCKNDSNLHSLFPSTYQECQRLLKDNGLTDCKQYFICLHKDHPNNYSIMNSSEDLCQYCKRPGSINYYYLGLQNRVKQWCSRKDMCKKMTGHWQEKTNWITESCKVDWGTPVKKELWDGVRFSELSYFWDPSKVLLYFVTIEYLITS